MDYRIGDCREVLRGLEAGSVQCCVTSPPYYGLRDYGVAGQIGLEPTPDEYVAEMVAVFREVKRVLRDDGVCFINIGDSYCSANNATLYSLREDCSLAEALRVGLEVFGVRFDRDAEACQGPLQEVLSGGGEGSAVCGRSDLARPGVPSQLSAASGGGDSAHSGAEQTDEAARDGDAGQQVRLLRGSDAGVSDAGPHQRGWRRPPEAIDGQGAGIIGADLSGSAADGLPGGSVPSALLELQLRVRVVGLLSARHVSASQIPAALRRYFRPVGAKPKDLLGIPWLLAFALRADGWFLRSDIIWHKPNPMPESVRDRPTSAHEHVFLLTKAQRYFYDAGAIAEAADYTVPPDRKPSGEYSEGSGRNDAGGHRSGGFVTGPSRNARNVWTIATRPYSGAHFATMPPGLAERCIKAGTSEKGKCPSCGAPWLRQATRELVATAAVSWGSRPDERDDASDGRDQGSNRMRDGHVPGMAVRTTTTGWAPSCSCPPREPAPCLVLDPFGGAGTTALVAERLGRASLLIDLNTEYKAMAEKRLFDDWLKGQPPAVRRMFG